jgi:hypothetical protein
MGQQVNRSSKVKTLAKATGLKTFKEKSINLIVNSSFLYFKFSVNKK